MKYGRGLVPDQAHKLLAKRPAGLHSAIAAALAAGLPASVDLSAFQPPILDQGPTGSCTAHSASGAIATAFAAAGDSLGFLPSPRLIYAATRAVARATDYPSGNLPALTDEGAQLADVCAALARYGVEPIGASVDGRASDLGIATLNDEADLAGLELAGTRLIAGEYIADPDSDVVAAALAAGIPVWVGFFCDSAFENLVPGQVAGRPNQNDPNGGGHAVYLSGYRGSKGSRIFVLTNSWGDWCDGGKCLVGEAWLAATWGIYPFAVAKKDGAA